MSSCLCAEDMDAAEGEGDEDGDEEDDGHAGMQARGGRAHKMHIIV